MNPAQTAKYLAWFEKHKDVMKAFALGEEIQHYSHLDQRWMDNDRPLWTTIHEYRINPKPREIYEIRNAYGKYVLRSESKEDVVERLEYYNKNAGPDNPYAPYTLHTYQEVIEV